jgi:phosphohistidine swiveling domain-containing protein
LPKNHISGIAASPGCAIGKTKIVFNINELEKIQQGDVLVAPMTNPDMVLAMRKCVAIVTDSGGMTSHAAIISRELGIPCVTGTQVATKVLRDGMFVKVDGTAGVVHILETVEEGKEVVAEFTIFGNRVLPFKAKPVRQGPLCPKIDYQWTDPELNEERWWIVPRPEIYGSFVQRSLISAGIERIPFALGFDDIGPLYVRYYENVSIDFKKIENVLSRLRQKLLGCDEQYWDDFISKLYKLYQRFDEATREFERQISNTEGSITGRVIDNFIEWWFVHNLFFSHTYLIQSMGDDIVWPRIMELLKLAFHNKEQVLQYASILSAPIKREDLTISTKFALETAKLIANIPEDLAKILYSNLDERLTIKILQSIEGGNAFIEKLVDHTQKWWWIRERDPYFDPITDQAGMISFIRKFAPRTDIHINLEENKARFDLVMRSVEEKLSAYIEEFRFLVKVGRTLNRERDNHHHVWVRNLSIVRPFFVNCGKKLKELNIIEHEKDVFFLTLPELIRVMRNQDFSKLELPEKINRRIAHLAEKSRLELHRYVQTPGPSYFDDVF